MNKLELKFSTKKFLKQNLLPWILALIVFSATAGFVATYYDKSTTAIVMSVLFAACTVIGVFLLSYFNRKSVTLVAELNEDNTLYLTYNSTNVFGDIEQGEEVYQVVRLDGYESDKDIIHLHGEMSYVETRWVRKEGKTMGLIICNCFKDTEKLFSLFEQMITQKS